MISNSRSAHIYLVGNPNAGKTLLFNLLTGQKGKVANFPGVTIELKTGSLVGDGSIRITDLPGIYSFTSRSADEKVATDAISQLIANGAPEDCVLAVLDVTQLQKGLYLVAELKRTQKLAAIVLTMADLNPSLSRQTLHTISARIGVPIFLVSAAKQTGIVELKQYLANQIPGLTKAKSDLPNTMPLSMSHVEMLQKHVELWLDGINLTTSRSSYVAQQIDRVALHPWFGPVVLVAIFFFLFEALFLGSKPFVGWIDDAKNMAAVLVHTFFESNSLLASLLADGIIGGVGSVLSFVPLIAILFFFLGALEDSGYMARAVFLLHRTMSKVGLSGRAFVPLVSGFSCSVPAILSTRIIESRSERLVTILITPLISCSARLPIFGLLIAVAFSQMPLLFGFIEVGAVVMVSMYLLGIVLAYAAAALLRRGLLKGAQTPLIMELPDYRWPRPRSLWFGVRSRVKVFVKEAGTVILALTILMWALFTFPLESSPGVLDSQESASHLENSYAGKIGHFIEPVIEPLGFNWKIGVGLVASFAAREVFISTFGVIYGLDNVEDSPSSLSKAMHDDINPKTGRPVYSPLVAISLLVFFAVALQCLSTVAATRKETASWRWPLFQIGYLNTLAWLLSFVVFQGGSALGF